MKISLIFTLAIMYLSTSYGQVDINDLYFLQGEWKTEHGNSYESWTWTGENSLKGIGYKLNGEEKRISEYMEIRMEGDDIVFLATVLNQNDGKTISFKLQPGTDRVFLFENKNHDFPSRIVYELVSLDTVQIRLYGNDDEKPYAYRLVRHWSQADGSQDFDFLLGEWKIHNKRRKAWLANSDEWIEFPAVGKFWKHLNGMVVLDEFYGSRNGQSFFGSNYRIYNKNTGEWTLYWSGTAFPDIGLIPQGKGKFTDGIGTFYGEEDFNGKKVKMRFLWKINDTGHPIWEQAYFDDSKDEWETNWKMELERL